LIDHAGSEIMSFADQHRLAQRRNVDRITGRRVAKVQVEEVAAIKQIAGCQVVVGSELYVVSEGPVKLMDWLAQKAGDAAELHTSACSYIDVNKLTRAVGISRIRRNFRGYGAAATDGERAVLVEGCQAVAGREAALQLGESGRGRRKRIAVELGDGGDNLLIKSAEYEHPVLDHWSTNGEAAKLVIEPIRLGQATELLVSVVQRIDDRVVLGFIEAAVPGVAALLGDDVDH